MTSLFAWLIAQACKLCFLYGNYIEVETMVPGWVGPLWSLCTATDTGHCTGKVVTVQSDMKTKTNSHTPILLFLWARTVCSFRSSGSYSDSSQGPGRSLLFLSLLCIVVKYLLGSFSIYVKVKQSIWFCLYLMSQGAPATNSWDLGATEERIWVKCKLANTCMFKHYLGDIWSTLLDSSRENFV